MDEMKQEMIQGLRDTRDSVFGEGVVAWSYLPHKQLPALADRALDAVDGLTAAEVLVLGAYMASMGRAKLVVA